MDGVHCLHPAPSSQTGMHEVGTTRCTKWKSNRWWWANEGRKKNILCNQSVSLVGVLDFYNFRSNNGIGAPRRKPPVIHFQLLKSLIKLKIIKNIYYRLYTVIKELKLFKISSLLCPRPWRSKYGCNTKSNKEVFNFWGFGGIA